MYDQYIRRYHVTNMFWNSPCKGVPGAAHVLHAHCVKFVPLVTHTFMYAHAMRSKRQQPNVIKTAAQKAPLI